MHIALCIVFQHRFVIFCDTVVAFISKNVKFPWLHGIFFYYGSIQQSFVGMIHVKDKFACFCMFVCEDIINTCACGYKVAFR